MQGVCEVTNDIYGREHVKDLRADMEKRIEKNMSQIKENRDVDIQEKNEIRKGMEDTNRKHVQLKTLYEDQYKDATYLDEKACQDVFDKSMTSVISSRGKEVDSIAENDVER